MVEKSLTPGEQKAEKDLPFKGLKSASFGRSERLLLKSDFTAVFNAPSGRFTVRALRMVYKENHLGVSRIGIIIPKKVVNLAATRNRYKRLIREQFRLVKACLPDADIVILLNRNVGEGELVEGCELTWNFLTYNFAG